MSDSSILSLEFIEPIDPESGAKFEVAVLAINDPHKGANVLSSSVLRDLERYLDQLDRRDNLAGLVIRSTKPGIFVAGADLREFVRDIDAPRESVIALSRRGQQLFGRLASCPFVTIAAIDGVCMGGGSELAVWCDRRILANNDKTSFAFPEVKLGLFPGWGGTARTPRIVGLSGAVELITSGEPIRPADAMAMGLADDLVDARRKAEDVQPSRDRTDRPESETQKAQSEFRSDLLLDAAVAMIIAEQQSEQYLDDRRRWSAPIAISETELGFLGATANAMIQGKTKGHYPAPLAALEVLLGGAGVDVDAACQMESEAFAELFGSPINRALLNVFFLQDANKKQTGVAGDVSPRKVASASVLGAGIMGQGIAAAHVKRRIPVALGDVSAEAAGRGVQGVLGEVSYNKRTKSSDVERALQFAPLITGTTNDDELAASDMVIEAVFEDAEVKKELFARLEPRMHPDAILCSNTSTIPISQLAADLKHPERFCGLHFFNPVRRMPLVEVIRGEKTSDATIATAVAHAKRIGKSPIVVGDGPGFLVNRVLLPYMNEALLLLEEGVPIKQIDRAATAFGMPMGPITLYDTVGLDIALHAGGVMQRAFPDRVEPSVILPAMLAANRRGKKNGRGFFDYGSKKGRGQESAEVQQIVDQSSRVATGHTAGGEIDLTDRLLLPMLLEATRVVEDGIVADARDVDLGLIYGIGFPPFRGGLFCWADTIGTAAIVERLQPYAELGPRYEPTPMLLELAKSDGKFYDA